jgi:hypothetical protein
MGRLTRPIASNPAARILCLACYEARHEACVGDLRPLNRARCDCWCDRAIRLTGRPTMR